MDTQAETPPNVVSCNTAAHYQWARGCDAWFLLRHEQLHVIEERMSPGTCETEHHHTRATQVFYVLRGELTMFGPWSPRRIRAGQATVITPGTRHRAANASSDSVEFLVISCPPSHGDRINDL